MKLYLLRPNKKLKQATTTNGPMASFTLGLMEFLGQQTLASNYWKGIAKACLSPEDYLLWKGNFFELCVDQVTCTATHTLAITKTC